MQCLNVKNKEVAALLNEYTDILGSYDAAYYVLSENNGYGLDKAPNGEPSKLYNDLMTLHKGDHIMVIRSKSMVYSDNFKNWFGDWLSDDKTNVSKVVDENGEPLIVYHNTLSEFSTFERGHEFKSIRSNEFTFHFGSKNAAINRTGKDNSISIPAYPVSYTHLTLPTKA